MNFDRRYVALKDGPSWKKGDEFYVQECIKDMYRKGEINPSNVYYNSQPDDIRLHAYIVEDYPEWFRQVK